MRPLRFYYCFYIISPVCHPTFPSSMLVLLYLFGRRRYVRRISVTVQTDASIPVPGPSSRGLFIRYLGCYSSSIVHCLVSVIRPQTAAAAERGRSGRRLEWQRFRVMHYCPRFHANVATVAVTIGLCCHATQNAYRLCAVVPMQSRDCKNRFTKEQSSPTLIVRSKSIIEAVYVVKQFNSLGRHCGQ